ncbi:hypothetical protein SEVIR_5G209600v4 [Setaria viridis]|uniref:BHLH domain-containing protein n=1 Tax=Setaria viridis TaxID=4556 RepID=A0A4U6UMF4_SETVI|nr:putative transcription factor bHLH041 [Setaria viridis]TKW15109.1 hypothetical protein SEVIR_5G209600v2 [Setaria viridis]
MDEVWSCLQDLQQLQDGDLAGLHPSPDLHDHDPFWPALADCAASFLAGDDTACFGVAGIDLSGGSATGNAVDGMDTASFFAENDDNHHLMHQQEQQQPVYSSSSLSSKRSLSIDSGGSSSTFFSLDAAAAGIFSSSHHSEAPAATQDPFAGGEDEALMRAMVAIISSASPSSSESSSPPLSQDTTAALAAVAQPRPCGGNASNVTVRSTSLAVGPEGTTSLSSAAGGGRQQEEDTRAAAGSNNSSQVYHMMSERKRREKLNDSFLTLRSLLPPCSKKDKTTVLINAASFLKTLEAQVSELEEKNARLERYVPREGATAVAAHHRRAKVHISRAASGDRQVISLVVMVMVECDIVDLVLHVLECLRWMSGVSVLSVDADTYSPQAPLKARANIKLHITDGDCWNEALFHETMTKTVHDATSSPSSSSCAAPAPLVAAA